MDLHVSILTHFRDIIHTVLVEAEDRTRGIQREHQVFLGRIENSAVPANHDKHGEKDFVEIVAVFGI